MSCCFTLKSGGYFLTLSGRLNKNTRICVWLLPYGQEKKSVRGCGNSVSALSLCYVALVPSTACRHALQVGLAGVQLWEHVWRDRRKVEVRFKVSKRSLTYANFPKIIYNFPFFRERYLFFYLLNVLNTAFIKCPLDLLRNSREPTS